MKYKKNKFVIFYIFNIILLLIVLLLAIPASKFLSKINLDPIKKNLKVLMFSCLYLSIIYEWLKESSSNNEKVMATLDQRLSLIENILI